MSRLPKNVFDSPFKPTAQVEEEPAAAEQGRALAVVSAPLTTKPPLHETPPPRSQGRKQTVYLTDEQILGLNERIFALRAQGKTAREANLTKVIAAAVDHYLAAAPRD